MRMPSKEPSRSTGATSGAVTSRDGLPGDTALEQRLRNSAANNRLLAERDELQEELKEVQDVLIAILLITHHLCPFGNTVLS